MAETEDDDGGSTVKLEVLPVCSRFGPSPYSRRRAASRASQRELESLLSVRFSLVCPSLASSTAALIPDSFVLRQPGDFDMGGMQPDEFQDYQPDFEPGLGGAGLGLLDDLEGDDEDLLGGAGRFSAGGSGWGRGGSSMGGALGVSVQPFALGWGGELTG